MNPLTHPDAPEEELFEAYGIELRTQVGKQLEGSVPFDIVIMEYEGEMPEETPEDPGETAPEMPETPETPEETAPETELLSIPPAVWGTVLALLALTAWHFGLAALRRRKLRQSDPNRAVIAAYRSMERMRAWGGELDPRLTELGGKARFSQHTLTEEERAEAIARLEETAKALEARLSWWRRMAFRWLWGR